jgi:predicted nucleic acid binding AN1-type Zn finger protein
MSTPYQPKQEIYADSKKETCPYCLTGKCAERRAAGLCACEGLKETDEKLPIRNSKESALATSN